MNYRPLPDCLTIRESEIHGLGVFATEFIDINFNLGIAHVELPNFMHGHCRTPLGGFYNHSEDPNCKLVPSTELFYRETIIEQKMNMKSGALFIVVKKLFTVREIEEGEEITCRYILYEVGQT